MQLVIASIQVKKRIRKQLDGIDELAASMDKFGQLHPISVTKRNVLVSGRRRLEAAKRLGWETIEAIVLSSSSAEKRLELELEENTQRANLTHEELDTAFVRLERLQHPGLFRRIWNAVVAFCNRLFGFDY